MGLSSFCWLFKDHRDLWAENHRLLGIIRDLEYQLTAKMSSDVASTTLIKQYQDEVLVELPYPDGKIPTNAWLTPGEDERVRGEDR